MNIYYILSSLSCRSLISNIFAKSPSARIPSFDFCCNNRSLTSLAIAASVFGFNLSNFFSTSLFKSQFGRLGCRENKSTSTLSLVTLSASWMASIARFRATSSTVSKSSGSFERGDSVKPSFVVRVAAS